MVMVSLLSAPPRRHWRQPACPAGRELVGKLCRDRMSCCGPTRCRTINSVRHCIPSAGRPACAWRCNPTEPPRRRVGWHCGMGGDSLGEAEPVEIDLVGWLSWREMIDAAWYWPSAFAALPPLRSRATGSKGSLRPGTSVMAGASAWGAPASRWY